MKTKDLSVVIGRFSPIHKGHIPLFQAAFDAADTVVCIIGSANRPSNPKNPFSAEQRASMIAEALKAEGLPRVKFVYMQDSHYREQAWIARVRKAVGRFADEILDNKQGYYGFALMGMEDNFRSMGLNDKHALDMHLSLHGVNDEVSKQILKYRRLLTECETCKIALVGHDKDESSYYLHHFTDWDLIDVKGEAEEISATKVRELWFNGQLSFAKSNLHEATYKVLADWPKDAFLDLQDEYYFLESYRKETQVGPFPVQFLTTDAVVTHGDEVLMIRRGLAPGKGLWALPGGFKDHNETFFQSCLRELLEETKIALPNNVLERCVKEEKMFDYPNRSQRGTTVSMAYHFVLDPTKPRPRVKGGDDAVLAWWFPLAELQDMRDQIYEDHMDIIEYMTSRN